MGHRKELGLGQQEPTEVARPGVRVKSVAKRVDPGMDLRVVKAAGSPGRGVQGRQEGMAQCQGNVRLEGSLLCGSSPPKSIWGCSLGASCTGVSLRSKPSLLTCMAHHSDLSHQMGSHFTSLFG